jgi:hypothetical protein
VNTVAITCCVEGCGYSPFPMERGFYDRALHTHEFWHCPAGHSQHFVGETDQQKRHRLEVERLNQQIANWRRHAEALEALGRTCPWPTCREYVYSSRDSLYEHMRRTHGMPTLALVREAS